MTDEKRKRGRPRKDAAPEQAPMADQPYQIAVTTKRVYAGDGRKWDSGQRLIVGDDITPKLAEEFLRRGHAIILDGKTVEETNQARRDAEAARMVVLQKSRADNVMFRHDIMSEEERLRAHEEHEDGEIE